MNLKQITLIGLVFLLFFCAVQTNDAFARTTTQYQLYRLSDDPSDDRRPKLAINDQGTIWVVWESDRDGDFDIYGRKFENGDWSDLVEIAQDTNMTLLCDILFDGTTKLLMFGVETNLENIIGTPFFIASSLFLKQIYKDSLSENKPISVVQHHNPELMISYPKYYPDDLPKFVYLNDSIFVCYHRGNKIGGGEGGWSDSLFMRSYQYEWSDEKCDTTFFNEFYGSGSYVMHFPIDKILLKERAIFLLRILAHRTSYPYSQQSWDFGLLFTNYCDIKYPFLSESIDASDFTFDAGISVYDYGSDKSAMYYAGYIINNGNLVVRRTKSEVDSIAIIKNQWQFEFTSNLSISQMSDLVAFVWSDSANIYIKTFQDSTWYETLELPLNGLTHIDHSFNCAVYNNQQIWITFDAIYNGNKDVYALSLPASFVVDTVMTSVKQSGDDKTISGEFALFQNYPNPFNSSTQIRYSLPQHKSSYHVILKIYDISGRLVNTLINQSQTAGIYSLNWDGNDMNGQLVSTGMYYYTLQADKYKETNKMLLIH